MMTDKAPVERDGSTPVEDDLTGKLLAVAFDPASVDTLILTMTDGTKLTARKPAVLSAKILERFIGRLRVGMDISVTFRLLPDSTGNYLWEARPSDLAGEEVSDVQPSSGSVGAVVPE